MAYKGDDLDLRAPQNPAQTSFTGYAPGEGEAARYRPRPNGQYQNGAQRAPALYVDETLLACCNHAYDIASANGAREVLIEHLVHALTRVPEAAQVLESRGIHVMALRRESATVIANDLPISSKHSGAPVKASSDFDAVLHLAAANARLRSERPTSVGDVLFVLMNYDRQSSGIELLRRHWSSWQQDDPIERTETLRRPSLERVEPRAPAYEPMPVIERVVERVEPSRVDRMQDARVEALFNSLHDGMLAQRNDSQNLRAAVGERLQRLEKMIEHGRHDNGSAALEVALTTRLQRLEKMQEALLSQRLSLAPLEAAMNDRFHRLEKTLEAGRFDQGKLPTGVNDRLQAMERMLEMRLAELKAAGASDGAMSEQLNERLAHLERAIERVTHAMPSGLIDRMQAMEHAFEAKITESMQSWGSIGERLHGLERAMTAHRTEVAHLQASGAQVQNVLSERAQAMERAIDAWRHEATASATRVPSALLDRLDAMEATLVAWRQDGFGHVGESGSVEMPSAMFERMQAMERAILQTREDATRLARTHEAAIGELRSGVLDLGSAHDGLTTAIDQWRQDHTGNLSVISHRLEAIEHSSIRPMEILESLNSRVQAMGMQQTYQTPAATMTATRTTVGTGLGMGVRGQRRGFWRWLFGLG